MMQTALPAAVGLADTIESGGPSIVTLMAVIIFFGAAAYFTGRLYGLPGMTAVIAGYFVVLTSILLAG
ncbi:MAG TPA: hypothetical protein VMU78_09580 [Methylocella sp.]|nr:hypothetical protein [Methylocella sp.]